ncbi:hypothetical protein [Roseateles saccharophilus]|uniref:hypothetical protein n=1 Tax=Roseateles saccharophilus TaxID=304 RepID=UPI0039EF0F5D
MQSFSLRGSAAALILSTALSALAQTTPAKPAVAPHATKKIAKAAPAKKAPPPEPVLTEASEEQLAAADRAYLGEYHCEFKQVIDIEKHPKMAGYIDVAWQKQRITMKPVLSSTGALRLEDVTGRTLMIQIANKSMLLDTKLGQRLVDDCVHPEQARLMAEARAAAAAHPETAAANSIGITPAK